MPSSLVLVLILLTLSPFHPVFGQQASNEFGLVLGGNLASHNTSFSQIGPYASCCPEFSNSTQLGIYLGGFYTLPLSQKWSIQARLTYASSPYSSTYAESSWVADLRDTPRVRDAVFTHEFDASLSTLSLEPMIGIRPFGTFDMFLGGTLGVVMTAHFTQTETLTEPEDYGAYLGAGRTWVNHDADIPDASSIRASALAMIRYSIDLNQRGTMFLAPELSYHLPLTNVTSAVDWKYSELRFGIAVGLRSPREESLPAEAVQPTPPPPPPPPAPVVTYTSTVDLLRRNADGSTMPLTTVKIEEVRVVDYLPVLGHIYFDAGSASVPSRYFMSGGKARSTPEQLTPEEATVAVLGIVARRMNERPNAKIVLTGSTSNTAEDSRPGLARERAEQVRDLLVSFGVAYDAIQIKARQLPQMPTRGGSPAEQSLAHEENRRVEITSTDSSLLDPVSLMSSIVNYDPDTVIVRSATDTPADQRPRMKIRISGRPVVNELLKGQSMEWKFSTSGFSPSSDSIVAQLTSSGQNGDSLVASRTAPIDMMTIERKANEHLGGEEIERYSLILFGFDNATITPEHERQLERIRERMRQGATVRILGMTDAMGSDTYNLELSRRRAFEVARSLGLGEESIEALGAGQPRFRNTIPEGRAYNRTVIIEVKTHR